MEGLREDETTLNKSLYDMEQKLRELEEQLELTQGSHQRAEELEKELAEEKAAHALTRVDNEKTAVAKGKIAKKKENVAQLELTKVKL